MIWILYAHFNGPAHKSTYTRYSPKSRQQKLMADGFRRICGKIAVDVLAASVRVDEISSKKELCSCIREMQEQAVQISEWHFVGYGTPYGPLLGNPDWPEQFSAYELGALQLPFAEQAQAWFYMEGSAIWLAPFMAKTFKITSYGCYRLAKPENSDMCAFSPEVGNDPADYDPIAALYAEVFSDITVRRDECRWLEGRLRQYKSAKVLDIGCGNGALLRHLSGGIGQGTGVDISAETVRIAAESNRDRSNLFFTVIGGPRLPFENDTFDVIVSLLSFRYLDWDPILEEMKRVLAPGGHILIVDMLASSPKLRESPFLMKDKLKNLRYLRNHQRYTMALHQLVTHPAWRKMIDRHPMHLAHEFTWYLKSRFPEGTIKVLNTGVKAKILAFDSGPVG